MPKALRSTSQGQYRANPIALAPTTRSLQYSSNNNNNNYANIVPAMQSYTMHPSMSLPPVSNGIAAHHSHSQSRHMSQDMGYQQIHHQHNANLLPPPAVQPPAIPIRASSGAWTPSDDATLMAARSAGQNWAPIQSQYFPNKTPNACRKRHERLMDRRNSDEWDIVKLEVMAKEYMNIRKEMWTMLAERTGEKWAVLEAKCMSSGLKNLQSQARACTRRERLGGDPYAIASNGSSSSSHQRDLSGAYTEDSGIGIDGLSPPDLQDPGAEDEFEYSSGAGTGFAHHAGDAAAQHQQQLHASHGHAHAHAHYQSRATSGYQQGPQGLTPETDGGRGYERTYGGAEMMGIGHERSHSMAMQNGYRLPSMGIGSIINPAG